MSFKIAASPHQRIQMRTATLMRWVMLATIPGIAAQYWFFGAGVIWQVLLAIGTALVSEYLVLKLRHRPAAPALTDHSAMLTGLLIGISIPPLAPWWIVVIGTAFAIIMVKQLYGGLGYNLFNPAMAAYVMLLISFPLEMTTWHPVTSFGEHGYGFVDAAMLIFTGFSSEGYSLAQILAGIDGFTAATPLDSFKTDLTQGFTSSESFARQPQGMLAGVGWEWVNLAYLAGGCLLLKQSVIRWHIPVGVLAGLFSAAFISFLLSPDTTASPIFHLFSGAAMLGAFFIATDPVSASTTVKGRLIYGGLIGVLVYLIRTHGGYPDGFAFAVLLANMCVPLIDYYTQPRTYGHGMENKQ
ncbi:electron transport complex subunit RsxD [Corallincola luteus]|uniref:Ion-translocating oxidoreductase complex subunit D n=1 Tax=Corallincola luteus TaxID=1775177 RepID=A0ABY2ATG6_9GAMM|nr:electron transport complex subunit RsxD [Corallincola luteus]TCI05557.1 electron transport complex subunit RsxD [Corallincola luteus]